MDHDARRRWQARAFQAFNEAVVHREEARAGSVTHGPELAALAGIDRCDWHRDDSSAAATRLHEHLGLDFENYIDGSGGPALCMPAGGSLHPPRSTPSSSACTM
jgi:hypothetical protein